MTFEMVDREKRFPCGYCESFRRGRSDHQGCRKAGAVCRGEGIHGIEFDFCSSERALQHGLEHSQVIARSDFWHHAAERRVDRDLRRDFAREQRRSAQDCDRRFIARCLDREDRRLATHSFGVAFLALSFFWP